MHSKEMAKDQGAKVLALEEPRAKAKATTQARSTAEAHAKVVKAGVGRRRKRWQANRPKAPGKGAPCFICESEEHLSAEFQEKGKKGVHEQISEALTAAQTQPLNPTESEGDCLEYDDGYDDPEWSWFDREEGEEEQQPEVPVESVDQIAPQAIQPMYTIARKDEQF